MTGRESFRKQSLQTIYILSAVFLKHKLFLKEKQRSGVTLTCCAAWGHISGFTAAGLGLSTSPGSFLPRESVTAPPLGAQDRPALPGSGQRPPLLAA